MDALDNDLLAEPLTRHEEIAPGVYLIGFRRTHEFLPGQAIKLGVDREHPPRIYSVCSGTEDDTLTILFNIKDDGLLTPRLAQLAAGDTVYASAPYGTFTGTAAPAWWIAAGTGIAPFYSMLCSGLGQNKVLVHGARDLQRFYFEEAWRKALGSNYHRCCSADASGDAYGGRVTAFLTEQDSLPRDPHYFICGEATMAVETRDILIAKGIPFDNIVTEIYF